MKKKYYQDISAYRISGLDIQKLEGRSAIPPGPAVKSVAALPLIVRGPRWVKFSDQYFRIQKEGLYRFWDWGKVRNIGPNAPPKLLAKNRQYAQVVFFRNDILTLLSSLAIIQLHGWQHHELSYSKKLRQAKKGNLSITCGYISSFCCELLKCLGWKARLVSSLRVEGDWNTYDCGHSLFEFYWPRYKKWVLADVDMHSMFLKNGKYLNLGEVSRLIARSKDFETQPLTYPGIGGVDTSEGVAGQFSRFASSEITTFHPALKKEWFRRSLRIPLICNADGWWFCCDDPILRKRAAGYSDTYKPMATKEWFKKFYP